MSIHEVLKQDKTYHFIEQEHKGIKYCYASNMQEDNIKVHNAIRDRKSICRSHELLGLPIYIWCGKSTSEWDKNPYFIVISLAESKNYQLSHKEVLRICGTSISYILHTYFDIKNKTSYINKVKRGIFGGSFEPAVLRIEKN